MHTSKQTFFLLLIISQTLHSIEEFHFSLWEVFAPARVVSGLLSSDVVTGFVIANASIVVFGFWCYLVPICRSWASAILFAWFCVILELGNGVGHGYIAINRAIYFPGAYTAPLLILFSCFLAYRLVQNNNELELNHERDDQPK